MQPDTRVGLLPRDLPDGREVLERGRAAGAGVTVGLSMLCEQHGVSSELEYKKKMRDEGRVMTTMNIGLQTWADTARAMRKLHEECERRGFRIDRYQMQMDRRMGVPQESRIRAAKETGPMLETVQDWYETTHTVPIQPGLGDMMIGSPMSMENATRALEAGVTYIGNMSQFAWKFPSWGGTDVDQMVEMTKALGLMASKRDEGATMQSYLDDGYPAQFNDFTSYIGWAMFERFLVTDVIGARLAISYGGLTHDPIMKTALTMALEEITPEGTFNPFYHCNTTVYTPEIDLNYGILSVDMLYLLLVQHKFRTGAAVLPIPVTEALRIPSWQEIVEVHAITRRVAEFVPTLVNVVDWERLHAIKDQLIDGGRTFFDNIRNGLSDRGVDLQDPLQVLLAIRRLGAVNIERMYAAGPISGVDANLDRTPLIPTDTLKDLLNRKEEVRKNFKARSVKAPAHDMRLIVASTDVHEFGVNVLIDALRSLNIDPIVAGTGVDPDELGDLALEVDATAILVSTHNGMALSYAQQLISELNSRRIKVPILFGGVLNQDFEGSDTPIDVRADLREIGIVVCDQITDLVEGLDLVVGTDRQPSDLTARRE
jgi:methylmalonyl-CoA mutase cobalamin-binding subunit